MKFSVQQRRLFIAAVVATLAWGCGSGETAAPTSDQRRTSALQQVADVQQQGPMATLRALPVREAMLARIRRMAAALDRFEMLVKSADGSAESEARLHDAFRLARRAYKEAEGLIAFYFPSTADLLNMPALPHVEDEDPNEIIRPPQGFQVIEEMIFPHFDVANRKDVLAEFFYLRAAARRAKAHATAARLTDRHVFEAMRQQLIRLQAHGLAGFDSPVALASLEEAAVVLEAMRGDLAPYRADALEAAPEDWSRLDEHLAGAITYLRSEDHSFETFDRLHFIRAYANPIMAGLRDVRAALGIEVNPTRTAVRPDAASAFSRDAFDPAFFAAMRSGEATPERVELGRLLFFDPVLSANNRRACASCHQPDKGFTDGLAKSTGFDFEPGPLRNAPTVINAGLQGSSAYDQTTETVEQRIRTVVGNVHEMNASLEEAAAELRLSPEYVARFEEAFGKLPAADEAADREMARGIEVALADYVRSLSSLDSPFDRYARGETDVLSEKAKRGFNLFMGKALCGTCHFMPLFNGTVPPDFKEHEAEIIGVPERPDTVSATVSSDLGKHALFGYELHKHAFKTPTVRNIALTAPYMHNGVYATLEEVVDFYNRGGGAGIGIELENQTLPPEPLNLTQGEMDDLVAFMEVLTDTTGLAGRPGALPRFPEDTGLNARRIGGEY